MSTVVLRLGHGMIFVPVVRSLIGPASATEEDSSAVGPRINLVDESGMNGCRFKGRAIWPSPNQLG